MFMDTIKGTSVGGLRLEFGNLEHGRQSVQGTTSSLLHYVTQAPAIFISFKWEDKSSTYKRICHVPISLSSITHHWISHHPSKHGKLHCPLSYYNFFHRGKRPSANWNNLQAAITIAILAFRLLSTVDHVISKAPFGSSKPSFPSAQFTSKSNYL